MKIREKLCTPLGKFYIETSKELEEISDDYAIEFAEWIDTEGYIRQPNLWISLDEKSGKTSKELLEIFKKEKGL